MKTGTRKARAELRRAREDKIQAGEVAKRAGYNARPGDTNPYPVGDFRRAWWDAGRDGAHVAATVPPTIPCVVGSDGKARSTFIPW